MWHASLNFVYTQEFDPLYSVAGLALILMVAIGNMVYAIRNLLSCFFRVYSFILFHSGYFLPLQPSGNPVVISHYTLIPI